MLLSVLLGNLVRNSCSGGEEHHSPLAAGGLLHTISNNKAEATWRPRIDAVLTYVTVHHWQDRSSRSRAVLIVTGFEVEFQTMRSMSPSLYIAYERVQKDSRLEVYSVQTMSP